MKSSRREFIRYIGILGTSSGLQSSLFSAKSKKWNIIFISVDDLNDWIGCFGGNPQVKTPHMDGLAKDGGLVFYKNYCAATVCCPSRAAVMWGIRPSTSGVYGNSNDPRKSPVLKDKLTMAQYFSKHGYFTTSMGKIFHKHNKGGDGPIDEGQWAYDKWYKTSGGGGNPKGQRPYNQLPLIEGGQTGKKAYAFDWGAIPGKDEETKDYKTALWAAGELKKKHDKPFFLFVGISKPHLPWFVPQKYFDMYPLTKVKVPEFRMDDLDDIKKPDGKKKFGPSDDFLRIQKAGKFKEAAQAYLAAVSYADNCIGVILDQLKKTQYKDNTVVVVWGDHGWFLGEKLKYRKTHLWEESARCPLIVKVPGMTKSNTKCMRVTNLIDMYPTLVELCGLPPKKDLEGRSFVPLLNDYKKKWDYPTLTTMGYKNHSVRDEKYAYSKWSDGAEEIYDHEKDPMEWKNLAGNPEYDKIKARLGELMPKKNIAEIAADSGGKAQQNKRESKSGKGTKRAEIQRLRELKDKEKDSKKKDEYKTKIDQLRKEMDSKK